MDVHVHEHAEQPRQDLPAQRDKRARKRHVRRHREDGLVVDLRLRPVHQLLDVLGRRQGGRLAVLVAVRPQVLVARTAGHRRACGLVAELRDGAVDQIDAIEEVDD